ncbi:uncharacterized protein LOC139915757 isoform X2 [Centroberyx gerrardi]
MSTSDSDYSIDWLASDEEDYDSPNGLSPQHTEAQPPPSSTTSLRESPANRIRSAPTQRRDDGCDCKDGGHCGGGAADPRPPLDPPSATPVQGFTYVGQQKPSWACWTSSEGAVTAKHHQMRKRAHSPGLERLCEKPKPETEKELFSQKCVELQCYVQPLSSILRGLRSGRYSERFSSFQESVAMDRIQRIMGVLQNPNMGERFLSIILKIEEMLQSWFPHVKPNLTVTQTDDSTPAKKQKHHTNATPPPLSLCSSDIDPACRAADVPPTGPCSATHLKWLHTSPICSLKMFEPPPGRPAASASPPPPPAPLPPPPPARCNLEVTQDNAVSSSTDSQSGPLHRPGAHLRLTQGPLPFKISSPCLERLLQAKESIIAPRTMGDGSTSERSWLS